MKQDAEKIINIEHANNVHIDAPGLFETAEKLNQAIESIPGLITSTIMLLSSKLSDPSIIAAITNNASLQNPPRGTIDVGNIVMSHWQIDRCIGKGSFSTVYEAHHVGNQYKSAIKVIHSSFQFFDINSSDATHRVYNASEMIRMELDNMVELRGTGYVVEYEDHESIENSDGSQDIIIRMELLQPLPDLLRLRRLYRDEVVRLGIDICKALEFCNKANVIHCDVKPSNIYRTKWGGYKLGDFSASTKVGEARDPNQIGTLKYMAPEVYHGKPFSANVDTYSLGLVLYELLKANEDLAADESALSQRISGASLPPISSIDQPFQSVINKACAYNPEDRFSSPTEMLNELLKLELRSK